MLAIVTAIWKRHRLTRKVLAYYRDLARKLPVETVLIVAGSEGLQSRAMATEYGAEYVEVPNSPLGAKWNAAAQRAGALGADAVLVTGSDDLVSEELIRFYLTTPREVQGVLDCYVHDLLNGRSIHWRGYTGRRAGETVGAGRYLPADALDDLNWRPWQDYLEHGLDGSVRAKLAAAGCTERGYRMKDAGPIICMKHRTMLTSAERTSGEEARPSLPKWAEEFRRKWTLGLDVLAKGDAGAGLAVALHSAAHVADEVNVLVDSRYSGPAAAMAKLCGATNVVEEVPKEYRFTGRIDFAAARNRQLEIGRATWRLVLDADEVLLDPGNLVAEIDRAEEYVDATRVSCWLEVDGRRRRQIRAYRRDQASWRYPVHNVLDSPGGLRESSAIVRTSYSGQHDERVARNAPTLYELHRVGTDDEKAHAAYHLAKLAAACDDATGVAEWASKSVALSGDVPAHSASWVWLIVYALRAGSRETAESLLTSAEQRHPRHPDMAYLRSMLAFEDWGEFSRASGYAYVESAFRDRLAGYQAVAEVMGWERE